METRERHHYLLTVARKPHVFTNEKGERVADSSIRKVYVTPQERAIGVKALVDVSKVLGTLETLAPLNPDDPIVLDVMIAPPIDPLKSLASIVTSDGVVLPIVTIEG